MSFSPSSRANHRLSSALRQRQRRVMRILGAQHNTESAPSCATSLTYSEAVATPPSASSTLSAWSLQRIHHHQQPRRFVVRGFRPHFGVLASVDLFVTPPHTTRPFQPAFEDSQTCGAMEKPDVVKESRSRNRRKDKCLRLLLPKIFTSSL